MRERWRVRGGGGILGRNEGSHMSFLAALQSLGGRVGYEQTLCLPQELPKPDRSPGPQLGAAGEASTLQLCWGLGASQSL